MKTSIFSIALLALTFAGAQAQQVTGTQTTQTGGNQTAPVSQSGEPALKIGTYQVTTRGANNQVWQRIDYETTPDGRTLPHIHSFTELNSGMHYWNNGQWMESQENIQTYSSGAIAQQGQYQVIFANNLNSAGSIDQQTPDGKQLQSSILGLAYYDSSSGNSVMIAQIQDSTGELISPNQALYPNAFEGVKADIRYTYKKGSFEQDVILREQPPTPESLSLNSDTTEIEVLTEFIDPPQASIVEHTMKSTALPDEDISWGAMRIGRGKAFDLGSPQNADSHILVRRQYVVIQGRNILIEGVPITRIQSFLSSLPLQSSTATKLPAMASKTLVLPKTPLAQAKAKPMKLASVKPSNKGFVLDYVELNSDQSDFIFLGDTTYYISDVYNFSGATTIEGGTVIKSDNNCSVNILGTLNCLTAAYRPAVFTSSGDNTVGEAVPGGSGAPPCTGPMGLEIANNLSSDLLCYVYDDFGNYYANGITATAGNAADLSFTAGLGQHYAFDSYDTYGYEYYLDFYPTMDNDSIWVDGGGLVYYYETGDSLCTPPSESNAALALANGGVVHDARFSGVTVGISSAGDYSVTNVQFVNCGTALDTESASLFAGNILMSSVGTGFYGQYFQVTAENLTFDQGTNVTDDPLGSSDTSSVVAITNALLTGVGGYGVVTVATGHVETYSSSAGVYQSAVGGNYYLANGSTNRNAGTASIDSSLLASLKTKTTYPPAVSFANTTISISTNFSNQVERDTNSNPDLGYHYDPMDYVFANTEADSNITFSAGIAVGWYRTTSGWYDAGDGIHMMDKASVSFNGTATAPDYWVRCNDVQEQDTSGGYGPGGLTSWGSGPSTYKATVNANFTRCMQQAAEDGYFRDDGCCGGGHFVLNAENCEFYSTGFGAYYVNLNITNCLFYRAGCGVMNDHNDAGLVMVNCTMVGRPATTGVTVQHWGSTFPVRVVNCAFEDTLFDGDDNVNAVYDYNAYETNTDRSVVGGSHDVTNIISFNWQSGWLGNFYLTNSSPLINAGSTTADQVLLYYFTTQTNQVEETNSVVDIGYHYVAVDANGIPFATFTNGVPDYIEDSNCNGIPDWWELLYFGNLNQPANGDYDGDGVSNYIEWLEGRNPAIPGAVPDTNGVVRLQIYTPLK